VREIHKETGDAMTMNVKKPLIHQGIKKEEDEKKTARRRTKNRWKDVSFVLAVPTFTG
jgi:hypothetical protein